MCKNCELKPVYEFTNQRKLCKNCFIRWFQKKVFYSVRRFSMISPKDSVGYCKGNDFRGAVLEDVLNLIAEKINIKLVRIVKNKRPKIGKLAVPVTADLTAHQIIYEIIEGNIKKLNAKPVEKNIIKPLYLFLDKEVLLYAKLKRLRIIPPPSPTHPQDREIKINSCTKMRF